MTSFTFRSLLNASSVKNNDELQNSLYPAVASIQTSKAPLHSNDLAI